MRMPCISRSWWNIIIFKTIYLRSCDLYVIFFIIFSVHSSPMIGHVSSNQNIENLHPPIQHTESFRNYKHARVVLQSGFTEWFYRVVLQSGFTEWFYRVVLQSGFTECFCRLVLQSGFAEWFCRVILQIIMIYDHILTFT